MHYFIFILIIILMAIILVYFTIEAILTNKTQKTYKPIIYDKTYRINSINSVKGINDINATICPQCKNPFNENNYCPICGTSRKKRFTYTFKRNNMNETEFINSINDWLAQRPFIANVKCSFVTSTKMDLFVSKLSLEQFDISFEIFATENSNQYAITHVKELSYLGIKSEKFLDNWQMNNQNAHILSVERSTHKRVYENSNVSAGGYRCDAYVFFKFQRYIYE